MLAFIRTNIISEYSLVTCIDAQVISTPASSTDLVTIIWMLTYMPAFIRKSDHTLVTSTDGKIVGWGRGKEGQLGLEGNPFASQVPCSLLQCVAVCGNEGQLELEGKLLVSLVHVLIFLVWGGFG